MRKFDVAFALGRIASDGVAIFVSLVLAYFFRMSWFPSLGVGEGALPLVILDWYLMLAIKITAVLLGIFAINGRYNFNADEKNWDEVRHLFMVYTAGLAVVLVFFFFQKFTFFSRLLLGVAWIAGVLLLISGRQVMRAIRRHAWQRGFGKLHVLVLGSGKLADETLQFLQKSPRYTVQGILTEEKSRKKSIRDFPVLGCFEDLDKMLVEHRPTDVLLATDSASAANTGHLARITHVHHTRFQFLPDESSLDLAAVETTQLGNFPMLKLHATQLGGWGEVGKSIIDKIFAVLSIGVMSPLLIWVALRIKFSDWRAPVLYGSVRVGRDGKIFKCWKFRTMIPNADKKKKELMQKNERTGGVLFKMTDDPRITPFGKFLRKTSIDELPQLWNILHGEMSMIGPRPHLPEEVSLYQPEHKLLLSIRPGLTGYAQINGRSSLAFEDEMTYELFYLKNWHPWLDVVIFFKTAAIVLAQKNSG